MSASSSFQQFGVDGRGWFVAVGGGCAGGDGADQCVAHMSLSI